MILPEYPLMECRRGGHIYEPCTDPKHQMQHCAARGPWPGECGSLPVTPPDAHAEQQKPLRGWQPIETVPRDGTMVLLYLEAPLMSSRVQPGFIRPNVCVTGSVFSFDAPKATHWQPLPQPPGSEA